MIISEFDEVLFWEDIECITLKTQELLDKYYPHDEKAYFVEKAKFYSENIPDKADFLRRLLYYSENGTPRWICGRSNGIDDLSYISLQKAYSNASEENGRIRVKRVRSAEWANHLSYYTDSVCTSEMCSILELTIGAGFGTAAVIDKMKDNDTYIGVDIDFKCAKTADG